MAFEDDEHLDPEALELLNQIAPPVTDAALDEDDDLVFAGESEETEEDGDPRYVRRSDFDRLSGSLDSIQKMLGSRDAAPTPAATYVPPAPGPAAPPALSAADMAAQREELQRKFFEDPIGFSNMIAQNAVNAEREQAAKRHVSTQATIARGEVSRLRGEFATQYPEYKSALTAMDQLITETSSETLAALIESGKLRKVYEDNFFSHAGRIAIQANRGAARRAQPRAQAEEPPQLGRMGNVTAIGRSQRATGKEIRMSDLSEVDQIAVREMRKLNFSPDEIAAALKAG